MAKKDNKKKNEQKSLNDLIIEEAIKQYKNGNIKSGLDVTNFLAGLLQPLMQKIT